MSETATAAWFLLSIATGSYIGPFPQSTCQMASTVLRDSGVRCMQPSYTYACQVDGVPGAVKICYKFDLPQVTAK